MQRLILLLFASIIGLNSLAQIAVGDWKEHLPYREIIDVQEGNGKVFAATEFSVFVFHKNDNSIERLSKINDLSDTGISSIAYNEELDLLVVGYETGNVDLIYRDAAFNIGDIARSDLIGDKTIYSILFRGDSLYVACGFGIVELDLERREVKDTYIIGPGGNQLTVYDIEIFGGTFYAATASGLFTADSNNSFLANFASWDRDQSVPVNNGLLTHVMINDEVKIIQLEDGLNDIVWYQFSGESTWNTLGIWDQNNVINMTLTSDHLLVVGYSLIDRYNFDMQREELISDLNDGQFLPLCLAEDTEGTLWMGTREQGLLRSDDGLTASSISPSGPPFFDVRRIDCFNNNMWVASGGVDQSYVNNYLKRGFYGLADNKWIYLPSPEGENDIIQVNDIMDVSIDPLDNSHIMFASWEEGVIEVRNEEIVEIYNEDNSTLKRSEIHSGIRHMMGGVDFDMNGNCWITNAHTNRPLHVRKANGEFKSFSFTPEISDTELIGEVLATREGQIWFILPARESIVVFDYNGTIDNTADDRYRILTQGEGEGGLPGDVFSMVEDLDGEIWIGTLEGVAVFYTPLSIFGDGNNDAQQILIEQGGNIQILLETEAVTAMELDGGNRKWVGTANSGVFLFSEDGLEQINHFTSENSPLLSNTITDIAINQATGEVFISTEKGLVSYKGSATNFDEEITNLSIYPNPVRPDFEGNIVIDGLAYQSDIKITDVSGNLVYSGRSNGGRAVWNGLTEDGQRVSTGIYLVFASKLDGSATNVGKIAFIR